MKRCTPTQLHASHTQICTAVVGQASEHPNQLSTYSNVAGVSMHDLLTHRRSCNLAAAFLYGEDDTVTAAYTHDAVALPHRLQSVLHLRNRNNREQVTATPSGRNRCTGTGVRVGQQRHRRSHRPMIPAMQIVESRLPLSAALAERLQSQAAYIQSSSRV
eukprot:GHVU01132943.1.p1 GENE.GHVU01132943.1~~GHVU01132943.1.p1  ORF type:complete len:160 (-),score=12.39 GHVU01132943.1:1121-1600(-)